MGMLGYGLRLWLWIFFFLLPLSWEKIPFPLSPPKSIGNVLQTYHFPLATLTIVLVLQTYFNKNPSPFNYCIGAPSYISSPMGAMADVPSVY
jgi:hypothetical protein